MKQPSEPLLLPLTPGPWKLERVGPHWRISVHNDVSSRATAIADVNCQSEADAVLIAAAPRMLDILLRWSRGGDAGSGNDLRHEVHELFAEIDKYYASGKQVVVDAGAAAEAAQWLAENEDEPAMTPERLAALEAQA